MTLNPFRWSFRVQFALGAAICFGLVAYALHTQFNGGLEPCPLCIFQRMAFVALGIAFLAGALFTPRDAGTRGLLGLLALVPAVVGTAIAGRHVWLQHLPPDQVPACGPPLEFMMEVNPITEVIRKVLTGSGECAKVDWTLLGLSMPEWSLAWFLLLTFWAGYAAFRRRG